MGEEFTFRGRPKEEEPKKAIQSFSVGDVFPMVGWITAEEVKRFKSGIIKPGEDTEFSETFRILATGSDFIPNGNSPIPFPFQPGDEILVSLHALPTAHLLPSRRLTPAEMPRVRPIGRRDEDFTVKRYLFQMMHVVGKVAQPEDMSNIHGTPTPDPLPETKEELLVVAEQRGVAVSKRWGAKRLRAAIEEADPAA